MTTSVLATGTRALAIGWLVLVLSACGDDGPGNSPAGSDGGPMSSADGGHNNMQPDASKPMRQDAGGKAGSDAPPMNSDGGHMPPDGPDAGTMPDSGSMADAGSVMDASAPADAGPDTTDGAMPNDAAVDSAVPPNPPGRLPELGTAGGRVTGGNLVLDVRVGHPFSEQPSNGGNYRFEGAVWVQP